MKSSNEFFPKFTIFHAFTLTFDLPLSVWAYKFEFLHLGVVRLSVLGDLPL
jgi:hypothetical protein